MRPSRAKLYPISTLWYAMVSITTRKRIFMLRHPIPKNLGLYFCQLFKKLGSVFKVRYRGQGVPGGNTTVKGKIQRHVPYATVHWQYHAGNVAAYKSRGDRGGLEHRPVAAHALPELRGHHPYPRSG